MGAERGELNEAWDGLETQQELGELFADGGELLQFEFRTRKEAKEFYGILASLDFVLEAKELRSMSIANLIFSLLAGKHHVGSVDERVAERKRRWVLCLYPSADSVVLGGGSGELFERGRGSLRSLEKLCGGIDVVEVVVIDATWGEARRIFDSDPFFRGGNAELFMRNVLQARLDLCRNVENVDLNDSGAPEFKRKQETRTGMCILAAGLALSKVLGCMSHSRD